ncbi:MAG: hypothetical protein ACTS3F_07955 [Phycisphaerales bacterium]
MQDARSTRRNSASTGGSERTVVGRIGGSGEGGPAAPTLPVAPLIKDAIIRSLSHDQRLLLVLWYVERMHADEIAVVLGTTVARVEQLHDSIVELLRAESAKLERGAA